MAPSRLGGATLSLSLVLLCWGAATSSGTSPGPQPHELPTVLFVGDSVTAGSGDAGAPDSFPAIVSRLSSNETEIRVLTAAQPGWGLVEMTKGMRQRLTEKPRLVIAQGGINDLLRSRKPAAVERDLEELLSEARRSAPMVVVMSLPDAPGLPGQPQQELRAITERVAGRLGIPMARISIADPVSDVFSADGIHPGKAGHLLIARMLLVHVRKAVAHTSD